jgi:hypothetical protein
VKTFSWSIVVTVVGVVVAFLYAGPPAVLLVLVLGVLEVSLSFDNAVVNATILRRMSPAWQRIFLTLGMVIAVLGMRLLLPFVVVAVAAGLGPVRAVELALAQGDPSIPGSYGYILNAAHPAIAAFGGMFLLMLFLGFQLENRELLWIRWLERPFRFLGRFDNIAMTIAISVLVVVGTFLATDTAVVLLSGLFGLAGYLIVTLLVGYFESRRHEQDGAENAPDTVKAIGSAALFLFFYLELIDASFSFDGVIGAFAISSDPLIIAIGLGIGAIYIRSLTVYFVRQGTLDEFEYLEHGAMWAVGALAVVLLLSIRFEIPSVVTGVIGALFIGAGLLSSIVRNRRAGSVPAPGAG